MIYFLIGVAITLIGTIGAQSDPTFIFFILGGIGLAFFGLYRWINNGSTYKNYHHAEHPPCLRITPEHLEKTQEKHSPEAYTHYINLKDYPTSENPHCSSNETYAAIILFIRRMYDISEKIYHGEPFKVNIIQLTNLIMNEIPSEYLTNEDMFFTCLRAYVAYYFSVDETAIYNKVLNDFEDEILVSDIIFKTRQKYIKEFEKLSLKEDFEITEVPDVVCLMVEVFNEMDLTPPLQY